MAQRSQGMLASANRSFYKTVMAICLLYRQAQDRPARFYRIELALNLFDEVSLLREWGIKGSPGQSTISLFPDLRAASLAADQHRNRMLRRGYGRA